jgi:hypothetical protein
MSQLSIQELTQASLTVIIGVSVYVFGQLVMMLFIDPINQLKLTIGEVFAVLAYYANIYTNPKSDPEPPEWTQRRKEAEDTLRQKAVQLKSRAHLVRGYSLAAFLRMVPKKEAISKAHGELIFLSNSCFKCNPVVTNESSKKIEEFLSYGEWRPWRALLSNISLKTLIIYAFIFWPTFLIVDLINGLLSPFLRMAVLRIGPVDLFGFFLPLASSIILLKVFYCVTESKKKKAVFFMLLILSISIAFQSTSGRSIGDFNTEILGYMVKINSFGAIILSYGLRFPFSTPSKRAIIQSLSGVIGSWISPLLSEIPAYFYWVQQGVLQEKLSYMVLGGAGLFDVLFFYGLSTALSILIFQAFLFPTTFIIKAMLKKRDTGLSNSSQSL